MKKKLVVEELEKIRKRNKGGLLQPKAVVDAARDEDSPLHRYFEWDDSKAADQHRLQQARELIVRVTVIRDDVSPEPFQAYVSLPSSRTRKNGGYSSTAQVMTTAAMREEMLQSAVEYFQYGKERYARLNELGDLFNEITKIQRRHGKTKQKAA